LELNPINMIASAVIQTLLLLSSGAFNVLLNPGSLSVEKQLFVSSLILMLGFAQGFLLILLKILIRTVSGWNLYFGSSYLFAPLTSAMSNSISERPGETDVITPVVTKLNPLTMDREPVGKNKTTETKQVVSHDGFDSDDDEFAPTASHFMPELELAIEERRNVYTDIYLLGIATFTTTYCIDTVSPAPTTAFLSGLLIMSITQSINIVVILTRGSDSFIGGEAASTMRAKRLLTVTSCIFATGAFVMFCVALGNANVDASAVQSIFDLTFSVILPLICPWLLVTVSPKQQPLRTLFECTPFVFTICFTFVMFFLATRGELSTILHTTITNSTTHQNTNTSIVTMTTNSVVEVEIHSDVNASLRFDTDIFSASAVDSAMNIPMLLFAPLVKIPTIMVVIANVINRSNLVVITALLVTMSLREMTDSEADESSHRAYCVAFALASISLVFNVAKYLSMPSWAVNSKRAPVAVDDLSMDLEEFT
jgi:hypothetical protein